jgi:hypothetical protein
MGKTVAILMILAGIASLVPATIISFVFPPAVTLGLPADIFALFIIMVGVIVYMYLK